MDAPHPGGLGGTFGGSPLSCAAAVAVLDEVATPEFRARADALGERLRAALDETRRAWRPSARCAASARCSRSSSSSTGRRSRPTGTREATIELASERGLVLSHCGTVRQRRALLVPILATDEMEEGLAILEGALVDASEERPSGDDRTREQRPTSGSSAVRKTFGDVVAVDSIDLEIPRGEFFTMLGPSGSGKTTTLRMIAGFERPDEGQILLGGDDVARQPPYDRDVNTVFQDYALFPHMTVARNVEYGLKVKKVAEGGAPRRASRRRSRSCACTSSATASRRSSPAASGSASRSRARSSTGPRVLLLDEPLGALDLKLRQEMQIELKRIQQDVGITFIYVTHDQDEALTMSDRIAVFSHGRIDQIGSPVEVYEHPATEFVAGFVGVSNVLERDGRRFTVRPEKIRMLDTGEAPGLGRRDRERRHAGGGLHRVGHAVHRRSRRAAER